MFSEVKFLLDDEISRYLEVPSHEQTLPFFSFGSRLHVPPTVKVHSLYRIMLEILADQSLHSSDGSSCIFNSSIGLPK